MTQTSEIIKNITNTDKIDSLQMSLNTAINSDITTLDEAVSSIKTKMGTVYKVKGSVANYEALEAIEKPEEGDVYNLLDTGANYVYVKDTGWDKLSETVDLSGYATTSALNTGLEGKVSTTTSNSQVYGTNASGEQTTYDVDSFGKVDDVLVDETSVVTNKVANIDLTGKIDHYVTMPTISTKNIGQIAQYIGRTNGGSPYIHGYFYSADVGDLVADETTLDGNTVEVIDSEKFMAWIQNVSTKISDANFGTLSFGVAKAYVVPGSVEVRSDFATIFWQDENGKQSSLSSNYSLTSLENNYGLRISGPLTENTQIKIKLVPEWKQVNVQPGSEIDDSAFVKKVSTTSQTILTGDSENNNSQAILEDNNIRFETNNGSDTVAYMELSDNSVYMHAEDILDITSEASMTLSSKSNLYLNSSDSMEVNTDSNNLNIYSGEVNLDTNNNSIYINSGYISVDTNSSDIDLNNISQFNLNLNEASSPFYISGGSATNEISGEHIKLEVKDNNENDNYFKFETEDKTSCRIRTQRADSNGNPYFETYIRPGGMEESAYYNDGEYCEYNYSKYQNEENGETLHNWNIIAEDYTKNINATIRESLGRGENNSGLAASWGIESNTPLDSAYISLGGFDSNIISSTSTPKEVSPNEISTIRYVQQKLEEFKDSQDIKFSAPLSLEEKPLDRYKNIQFIYNDLGTYTGFKSSGNCLSEINFDTSISETDRGDITFSGVTDNDLTKSSGFFINRHSTTYVVSNFTEGLYAFYGYMGDDKQFHPVLCVTGTGGVGSVSWGTTIYIRETPDASITYSGNTAILSGWTKKTSFATDSIITSGDNNTFYIGSQTIRFPGEAKQEDFYITTVNRVNRNVVTLWNNYGTHIDSSMLTENQIEALKSHTIDTCYVWLTNSEKEYSNTDVRFYQASYDFVSPYDFWTVNGKFSAREPEWIGRNQINGIEYEKVVSYVGTNISWDSIDGTPTFATVATSGSYTDLTNKPTIPSKTSDLTNDSGFLTSVSWSNITNKPETFTPSTHSHTVSDISDFPTIPDAQIQSDWAQTDTTAKDYIKNKPTYTIPEIPDKTKDYVLTWSASNQALIWEEKNSNQDNGELPE